MENLHQSLLRPSTSAVVTTTDPDPDQTLNHHILISSNSSIILRLSLVFSIALISIFAQHESSKGFSIKILNESPNSPSGKHFHLFYVSNDAATRIIFQSSHSIQQFLYPSHHKTIDYVTLRLSDRNLSKTVAVSSVNDGREIVLNLSASAMNSNRAMVRAVTEGMTRGMIWNGRGQTPAALVNGIVEFVVNSLDGTDAVGVIDHRRLRLNSEKCWKHGGGETVAEFLEFVERRQPGFVRRLNEGMRDGWDERLLDGALGRSVEDECTRFKAERYNVYSV